MSDLFGNHIVVFPTRRLIYYLLHLPFVLQVMVICAALIHLFVLKQIQINCDKILHMCKVLITVLICI